MILRDNLDALTSNILDHQTVITLIKQEVDRYVNNFGCIYF